MLQLFKKSSTRSASDLVIGLYSSETATRKRLEAISQTAGQGVTFADVPKGSAKSLPAFVNVVAYDLDVESEESIAAFNTFMADCPRNIPVIVLTAQITDEMARWFLQLRVADWVKKPIEPGELIASCGRARGQLNTTKTECKVHAFMGAKGGVGTTVIAVQAAFELNRRKAAGAANCLVDLDLINSSCADYLDLEPAWPVADLSSDPGRLDSHMFDGMLSRHKSGLSVLASQLEPSALLKVPEDVIAGTLEMATQKFAHLVIDLPRSMNQWMDNVLAGASEAYVVTEFTVPGLKAARRMVNQLLQSPHDTLTPKVIVNRYERSLFGSALSASEAKDLLGPYLAGFVGEDRAVVAESVNRGVTVGDIKPKSRFAADIAKILDGQS